MNTEQRIRKLLAADLNRELLDAVREVEKTGLLRVVIITDGEDEFTVFGTGKHSDSGSMLRRALNITDGPHPEPRPAPTIGEAFDVLLSYARGASGDAVAMIFQGLRENFPEHFKDTKTEIMRDALQQAELKLRSVAVRLENQGCGSIPKECLTVAAICRAAL